MYTLSMFDKTGNMTAGWNGYKKILIDSQHPKGRTDDGDTIKIGAWVDQNFRLEEYLSAEEIAGIKIVFGFPPCTDLAVSGARWFKAKKRANPKYRKEAMDNVYLVRYIGERLGVPYMIENPVSVISTEWRKPDFIFHPYHFTGFCKSDNYTKKTCLWTGNGFNMPATKEIPGIGAPDDRIHKAAPSPERANFRSATPKGFAMAVYLENKR